MTNARSIDGGLDLVLEVNVPLKWNFEELWGFEGRVRGFKGSGRRPWMRPPHLQLLKPSNSKYTQITLLSSRIRIDMKNSQSPSSAHLGEGARPRRRRPRAWRSPQKALANLRAREGERAREREREGGREGGREGERGKEGERARAVGP